MLEIVQIDQAGKKGLLFDMHRLRKKVFKDRMGWNVSVNSYGLEIDEFDLPEAIYVLALNKRKEVVGNWRLLPTTGPTMIRNIWPDFLKSIEMPCDPYVWEASRFGVNSYEYDTRENIAQTNLATNELFCGVAELSLLCGIKKIYALYDDRIGKILKKN